MRKARVFPIVMTDPSDSAKANASPPADLEEARLRQQAIGVKLRHMFDQVINEPVPDEFLEILRRAEPSNRPNGGGEVQ